MSDLTDVELGRSVVALGDLQQLRTDLGLNRNSMAELLHASWNTYAAWEDRPSVKLWPQTAARVGRFYRMAKIQLDLLHADGISIEELMPFDHLSAHLGIPHELLLRRYREGSFEAEDLGILGLWVYREDLDKIRETI